MFGLKEKAKDSARRAGLVSAGGLFLFMGLGFLTLAGWFFLIASFPPLEAALILAIAYFGLGFILIAVGTRSNSPHPEHGRHHAQEGQSDAPPLVQAFLYGMQAGAKAGGSWR